MPTLRAVVERGLAATFLPAAAVDDLARAGRVDVHPLRDTGLRRPLAIARAPGERSPAAAEVERLLTDELRAHLNRASAPPRAEG